MRLDIKHKIVIGIATMNSRYKSLNIVLDCLNNQTLPPDRIIVYNNDENEFNATDNGKFYYFSTQESIKEEVIFLSMDDDILYPNTYVEDMVNSLIKYDFKSIVTHHGRKIIGTGLNYYRDHKSFSCLKQNDYEGIIDVAGTGVTAFHTSYFRPNEVFNSEYKRMSDCVFSLEATKKGKEIIILKHRCGYLKDICFDTINSCHRIESKNPQNQSKIADEIFKLKK